jgi:hypothetical protein
VGEGRHRQDHLVRGSRSGGDHQHEGNLQPDKANVQGNIQVPRPTSATDQQTMAMQRVEAEDRAEGNDAGGNAGAADLGQGSAEGEARGGRPMRGLSRARGEGTAKSITGQDQGHGKITKRRAPAASDQSGNHDEWRAKRARITAKMPSRCRRGGGGGAAGQCEDLAEGDAAYGSAAQQQGKTQGRGSRS